METKVDWLPMFETLWKMYPRKVNKELACEELMSDLEFDGELDKHYNLQANIEYFKTKAREMMKSE